MVKVAEVGVAKHDNAVSGANSGTSMYLAPEVFENRITTARPICTVLRMCFGSCGTNGETVFRATIDSGVQRPGRRVETRPSTHSH